MIELSAAIRQSLPDLRLGIMQYRLDVEPTSEELLNHIATANNTLAQRYTTAELKQIPTIAAARAAYQILGKEPSRYRLSAEALLRRVIKGKGLYQINNVVDTLNLISIQSGFSIGGYDLGQIKGAVTLGIGKVDEPYHAIGRGLLNIENLPVLRDEQGAFGSPTSDSERSCVRDSTQQFLIVFFDFGKDELLLETLKRTTLLLNRYASATLEQQILLESQQV